MSNCMTTLLNGIQRYSGQCTPEILVCRSVGDWLAGFSVGYFIFCIQGIPLGMINHE